MDAVHGLACRPVTLAVHAGSTAAHGRRRLKRAGWLIRRRSGSQFGRGAQIALCPTLNRTGAVWHVCVEGLRDPATLCWAWRAEADVGWVGGSRFVPGARAARIGAGAEGCLSGLASLCCAWRAGA